MYMDLILIYMSQHHKILMNIIVNYLRYIILKISSTLKKKIF